MYGYKIELIFKLPEESPEKDFAITEANDLNLGEVAREAVKDKLACSENLKDRIVFMSRSIGDF